MARGEKRAKTIQVKSAHTSETEVVNLVELSKNVGENTCKLDKSENFTKMTPDDLKLDLLSLDSADSLTIADTEVDYAFAKRQIMPNHEDIQKKMKDVNFEEVQPQNDGLALAPNAADILEPNLMSVEQPVDISALTELGIKEEETKKKKKRKNKKKNKKMKKANADAEVTDAIDKETDTETKRPARLAPIKKNESAKDQDSNTKEQHGHKNVGCFGFINNWLVKRKEKRRAKKRKAIEARKAIDNLVVYDNRRSKGGVAFTVELDSRPIDKSVLPPIKKRPGPIRMATEQKLEKAESKREDNLNKKREAARAHSRLVRETADRRAQHEKQFKQSTYDKVVRKGNKAAESRHVNKTIETARAHSRLVRETADRRAYNEAEFKQATLYKVLLKEEAAFQRLQHVREDQRSRCASRCATRCASRMDSARGINADYGTFLEN